MDLMQDQGTLCAVSASTAPPAFPDLREDDLIAPTTYTLRPTEQDRKALAVVARHLCPDAPSALSMTIVVRAAVLRAAERAVEGLDGASRPEAPEGDREGLLRALSRGQRTPQAEAQGLSAPEASLGNRS